MSAGPGLACSFLSDERFQINLVDRLIEGGAAQRVEFGFQLRDPRRVTERLRRPGDVVLDRLDHRLGFKDGLGAKAKTMIVKEASYEVSDPARDSQMVQLQASGADTFFNITTPKFAAQAIRKAW